MSATRLYKEFFSSEKTGGLLLVLVTVVSLLLANSSFQSGYLNIWNTEFSGHTITHWINDGLMAIFFLLIGLELEREIYQGELSDVKNAALPVVAALGGMLVPAAIFLLLNYGLPTQSGAGIPMATDIAFAIGILSLLGNKVPLSLKIFLTALAVIDDLGAILVIAIFYSGTLSFFNLCIAFGIWFLLLGLKKLKVYNLIPYLIGGVFMWYFMLHSGIHATISGVLLAFAIPFSKKGEKSPSYVLEHLLNKPVAFLILPLFAMANTCLVFADNWTKGLAEMSSMGVILGLVIGKPLGISLFAFLGVYFGVCKLPKDLKWKTIAGAGFLGGIGFTMSIFITLLAYGETELINNSKIAILLASAFAAVAGLLILSLSLKKK